MTWPLAAAAALGAFHGLNPAMGWLFAAALGLHRGRPALLKALPPIAAGHAASASLVSGSVLAAGALAGTAALRIAAGALLILWALFHLRYGHRHRVRYGMTAGLAGLFLWSFLMATAHGAGLMLVPALLPLCGAGAGLGLGLLVHAAAMLAVTAALALAVHDWLGVVVLRRGWINFDWLWGGMLGATGIGLIATA